MDRGRGRIQAGSGSLESDAELDLLRQISAAPPVAPLGSAWGERGRYVIERLLGRGGMGTVYVARDVLLKRDVALKVLDRHGAPRERGSQERLFREARVAASVEHHRIARVYDVGEHAGLPFVAMELVRGVTLRRWMADRDVPCDELLTLALQIAEGLAVLHGAGIVHRDLKPENVMLADGVGVKLLDFGLAAWRGEDDAASPDSEHARGRGQSAAVLRGTPGYMAPEQLRAGDTSDPRVDVFAFGTILDELVSRREPAVYATLEEALAHAGDPPRFESGSWSAMPVRLRLITAQSLARDAAARYADGAALLEALRELAPSPRALSLLPAAASHEIALADTMAAKSAAPSRRRTARMWTVLGGLAAVAVLVAAAGRPARPPQESAAPPAASATGAPITSRPPVPTERPEARTAYDAALRLLRGASVALASRELARALEIDPHLAAAHLRLATYGMIADPMGVREHLAKAREHARGLGPEDAAALEIAEASVSAPADRAGMAERWTAVDARFPLDAETALQLAMALDDADQTEAAEAAFARAIALDPGSALALLVRGVTRADRGDDAGALADYDQCLRLAPAAMTCLRRRAAAHERLGDCVSFERDAQQMTNAAPDDPQGYLFLSRALAATGASVDSVSLARRRAAVLFGPPWTESLQATGDVLVNLWTGDLAVAERGARALLRDVEDHVNEFDHEVATSTLLGILDETDRSEEAARIASHYVDLVPAWSGHEPVARGHVLRALRRSKLPRARYEALRDAWVADLRATRGGRAGNLAWIVYFAQPAVDRADALRALDVLPRFTPLPTSIPSAMRPTPLEEAIGRVYLLAGRAEEAVPYLSRAAGFCSRLEDPLAWRRAELELGRAKALLGDAPAACAAYRDVGTSKVPSATERAAADAARSLGCPP
jgi:serine/threonine-protein kinase